MLLLCVSDQMLSLQIVVRWRCGRVGRVVERLVGVVGVVAAVGRVVFPGRLSCQFVLDGFRVNVKLYFVCLFM